MLGFSVDRLTEVVTEVVRPRLFAILEQLAQDGKEAYFKTTDGPPGQPMFAKEVDPFVTGSLLDLVGALSCNDQGEILDRVLARRIVTLVQDEPQGSWGILFALRGLVQMQRAGLLDDLIRPDVQKRFRADLTPDEFLDPTDMRLRGKTPSNFYGVALGIRLARAELGWDEPQEAQSLLRRIAQVFSHHASGIADELEGEGRFDGYSFFLPFDMAGHYLAVDREIPQELVEHIRRVLPILLRRMHADGTGIDYGRSIGPHGEVPLARGLAIAASCGLLTRDEVYRAAAYGVAVAKRLTEFWWNDTLGSIDLWHGGRATDRYRGPHRMLAQNVNLGLSLIRTAQAWQDLVSRQASPASVALETGADSLCHFQMFSTPGAGYARALVTLSEAKGCWSLPLINGGPANHRRSDYLPIPYRHGYVVGAPLHGTFPQLVPRLRLADGTEAMPTVFFTGITCNYDGSEVEIDYTMPVLCADRQGYPVEEPRWQASTHYSFTPGRIRRRDVFRAVSAARDGWLDNVIMMFASMAPISHIFGPQRIAYEGGGVIAFESFGFSLVETVPHRDVKSFRTPAGPYASVVRLSAKPEGNIFQCGWDLVYQHDQGGA